MLAGLIFCPFYYLFLLFALHNAAYLSLSPSWSVRFWVEIEEMDMKYWMGDSPVGRSSDLHTFVFKFLSAVFWGDFSERLLLKLFISHSRFPLCGHFLKTYFDPGISEQISKQMNANLTARVKIRWHFFHWKVSRGKTFLVLLSPNFPPEPGLTL